VNEHFDKAAEAILESLSGESPLSPAGRLKAWLTVIVRAALDEVAKCPVPMLLWCPECSARHLDVGDFATKAHHTHACQECGHCWRPAVVPTCGVRFLPGFKNGAP
jgi:hypothetical protein